MNITNSVEVCNLALLKIGKNSISALKDDSVNARACNTCYDQARMSLLAEDDWTFATKTEYLTVISPSTIIDEYSIEYSLPNNFIRLICLMDSFKNPIFGNASGRPPFIFEGRKILTNINGCVLKFVHNEENISNFPPELIEVLYLDIACRITKQLNDSTTLLQQLLVEHQQKLSKAKISNCQQTMLYSARPSPLMYTTMEF